MDNTALELEIIAQRAQIKYLIDSLKALEKRVSDLEGGIPEQKSSGLPGTYDRTRYLYEGEEYRKNRLVLAVVKDYVRTRNPHSAWDVEKEFLNVQGTVFGVLRELEDVRTRYPEQYEKRYFTREDDRISINGTVCVVCNQWHKGNIDFFVERARELGFDIKEIKHNGEE